MGLIDLLPEKNIFLLWSEKNIDCCINLLNKAGEDWVVGFNIPRNLSIDESPGLRKYSSLDRWWIGRVNYHIYNLEDAVKRLQNSFSFNFVHIPELKYWRKWMMEPWLVNSPNKKIILPEPNIPFEKSKKNTEYCIKALEEFHPHCCIAIYDSNKTKGEVWHQYDVEGAQEHGVKIHGYFYISLQDIRKSNFLVP